MPVDAPRYRREVLDPARAAGNRPPDDLIARYQLREPLTPDGVRDALAAVRAHWRTQRATLAYRKVIDALEADDRRLQPVLDAAGNGDLGPLREEIQRRQVRAAGREQALADELAGLAEPLHLLPPAVVDQVVADGHDREQVDRILGRLGVQVRDPDPVPTEPPVRAARSLREALTLLDCRHTADFLFGRDALAPGFTVLDGFRVADAPALRLDQQQVAATARQWQSRLDGKTPAENVLTVLRGLADPDQLRALLVYECAEDLRRRRDRLASTAALVNRARELGLAGGDADRLVFAVRHEPVRHGSVLAGQLAELLAEGQVLAAHRLVAGVADADLPADAQELAAQAGRLAQAATTLRDQAETAAASGDSDAAWRLLDEALAHAPDLPEVDPLRRRLPPAPPDRAEARVEAGEVLVSWPASASRAGELRYRVVRSDRPVPAEHAAGTVVAETADTRVVDRAPPVNTPLHYAVVAMRGGVAAPPVAALGPAWFRPEATGLQVTPGEGIVAAAWSTPPGADRAIVRRAEDRPPRDTTDGTAVVTTGSSFTDQVARTGVTYHYLLVTVYTGPNGRSVYTAGVRFTAVPVAAPEPVPDLTVERLDSEPGWLRLTFPAPRTGTVAVRELDEPPEQAAGSRLSTSDLPGRPVPSVPVPGGLKLRAPPPPALLLAVTVNGDQAVIGPHRQWQALPTPARLRVQPRGGHVLVTWQWPAEVGEVEVRWRPVPEAGGEPGPEQVTTVTGARYRTDGGVRLPLPAGARYQVSAVAVVRGAGQRLAGPAATVTVALPPVVSYTIVRSGLFRRRINVQVMAETPVRMPQLLLVVTAGELPLRPEDGDVLAGAQEVTAAPEAATVFTVDMPRRPRPYWLRCFAKGGQVMLHDPPPDQLRVS